MILQLRAQNWERMQIEFYSRMHKIGNKMQKPQGFWHTQNVFFDLTIFFKNGF